MSNLRVAVLLPPPDPTGAADRADTFVQATEIGECLEALGNEVLTMIFADDRIATAATLRGATPDLVINLVEDVPEGPDQLHVATALLDDLGLPYTGAPTTALLALGDKRRMKAALRQIGLPTPDELGAAIDPPVKAPSSPHLRYIVKSAIEHASIGIDATSIVTGRAAADAAIAERQHRFGGAWFAEAYIEGREFNVALLETSSSLRTLPVAEICFLAPAGRPQVVGYAEKWAEGTEAYAATPRRFPTAAADQPLLAELQRLARVTWNLFGLRSYARLDFRVDTAGRPYILDVNANPCLARDAGFCAAAAQSGLTQTEIVAILIETALA